MDPIGQDPGNHAFADRRGMQNIANFNNVFSNIPFVLILWLFNSRLNGNKYICGIIIAYAFSKLVELFDARIYSALGLISGHTLKHLIAALATYIYYRALRKRQIVSAKGTA